MNVSFVGGNNCVGSSVRMSFEMGMGFVRLVCARAKSLCPEKVKMGECTAEVEAPGKKGWAQATLKLTQPRNLLSNLVLF